MEKILFTDEQIARRIKSVAPEIERDFRGRELVVVSLLSGTVMFLADLIRNLSMPLRLDFIGDTPVMARARNPAIPEFTKELRLDVKGRDVLLVDDILDTGKTLSRVVPKLLALGARRIQTCVLLDKPARRTHDIKADYIGFEIPDFFVVGYGLDFAERYRNLPFVGVLHPAFYKGKRSARSEMSEHHELHFTNLLGWLSMLLIAWAISYNRKLFPWRTVMWGLGLQLTLAILVLKTPWGASFF